MCNNIDIEKISRLKLQYLQTIDIEEVLMLSKWYTENWYWTHNCKITQWSIVIGIDIAKSYPPNWLWYWYCKKKMSKILQHFRKSYEVNIATILRLNHKYCRKFSIEKILKHVFHCNWYWNWDWNCRNIFSEIEIEIEIEEISSKVLKLRLRLQL